VVARSERIGQRLPEWYADLQARIDQLKIDGEKNDDF